MSNKKEEVSREDENWDEFEKSRKHKKKGKRKKSNNWRDWVHDSYDDDRDR